MTGETPLRILVIAEGDVFVAQCLDIDVCTAASTLLALRDRMNSLLDLEIQVSGVEAQAVDPAPSKFHKMWDNAAKQADCNFEYRMAVQRGRGVTMSAPFAPGSKVEEHCEWMRAAKSRMGILAKKGP